MKHDAVGALFRRRGAALLAAAATALVASCGGGGSSGSVPAPTYSIGGTISGLVTGSVVLANGSDTVSLAAGATSFTFGQKLAAGASYSVTVKQSTGVACFVNGTFPAIVGNADVTSVVVSCVPPPKITSLPMPLYVATVGSAGAAVQIFNAGLSGAAPASASIAGINTGLASPFAVAVDAQNRIYVGDYGTATGSVFVFAAGASGNVAPARTILGVGFENGGTNNGLAVDSAGFVYVTSAPSANSAVKVYGPTQSGNVTPARTIAGVNSGISSPYQPQGLALDSAANTYVSLIAVGVASPGSQGFPSSIKVYAAGASGDATPLRTISGSNTGLVTPQGLATDGAGRLYVADSTANAILVFAAGASGNASPVQVIAANPLLQQPQAIALDAANNIYVNELLSHTVTVFDAASSGVGSVLFSIDNTQAGQSFIVQRGIALAH